MDGRKDEQSTVSKLLGGRWREVAKMEYLKYVLISHTQEKIILKRIEMIAVLDYVYIYIPVY